MMPAIGYDFMKWISITIIIIILATSISSSSDWPLFKRDAVNSGISPDRVPDSPIILWSADIQRMETTPLVFQGLIYALTGNGSVNAMNQVTGELIWQSQLEGWVFQMSSLACNEGEIFAATDSGILAALDSRNGSVLWTRNLTDKRFESPINCIDGRVFLGEGSAYGTGEKRFFCFDEKGRECWNITRNTKGYQWCGASDAGSYLVFGGNDGVLFSVKRTDGKVVDELRLNDSKRLSFSREEPGRIRASTAFRDGFIYVTSEHSAEAGYAWKIRLNNDSGLFEDRGWSAPVGFSTSTPSVYCDRVYLGVGEHGHPGALICLNDSNGELIWSYSVEAGVKSSPAISTAHEMPRILFTTAQVDGLVYCIEDAGDSERLVWRLNPPDPGYILGGVAISDGRVYFGTEGDQLHGKLYCLAEDSKNDDKKSETKEDASAFTEGWPQFHSDPQHHGYSNCHAPRSNQTIWVSGDIGAQPGSSVSVADGAVYVNCVDNLTCLDRNSGEALWSYPFPAAGDFAFGFTPACCDGRVFFTSDRTYCLNASNGSELWSFAQSTGKPAIDASPAIAEGLVLVSDWDGHHYYCLDEETGEELWNFTVLGNAQSTAAVDCNRAVFAGWQWGLGGTIYCVNLRNGSLIWNISTDNSPCGSATISNGSVFMSTYSFNGDGDLLALSLDNGSILWTSQVSPTDSTPVVVDGRVYLCGGCEGFSTLHTYCFDALNGKLLWMTPKDLNIGDWRCSPAFSDGILFAGSPKFTEYAGLYALNSQTGEVIWSYPEAGSSPALADGILFSIGGGRVYAFGDDHSIRGNDR